MKTEVKVIESHENFTIIVDGKENATFTSSPYMEYHINKMRARSYAFDLACRLVKEGHDVTVSYQKY